MNNQNNPFAPAAKKKLTPPPANFVEALKSIGGQTVKSLTHDALAGTAQDMMGSILGNTQRQNESPYPQYNPEWGRARNEAGQEAARLARHKEVITTPVFDRRQEEVKAQIKALQDQLKALAKDMATLGTGIQKAVEEEITNPGTYHLSFFEKLQKFIIMLRKNLTESRNWLEISSQRRASQRHYWGGVQKSGTKFMLSQERYMVTQTG